MTKEVFGFWSNAIVHWLLIGTGAIWLVEVALLVWFIRPVEHQVVLHYNVYLGVDVVGPWWHVYVLPGTGLFISVINTVLAHAFFVAKERIATHIVLFNGFVAQIGLVIAVVGLIIINN